MEYVPGDTLDRLIEMERKLPLDRATKFIREITSGLAAAHRAGIIHRDIKPGNIIVSPDGKPHLTDFGLARHSETKKGLTVEGTFLGTPEYASPEQVEGKKLDHRTDLYSMGVTYYQLLSGSLPFLGESPMEIAIKRTKEEPRPLENALPGADPRACAIVKKLLRAESGQRYQSATDLIRDLDAILQGPRQTPTKTTETTKKVENVLSQAKTKRRIRMLIHWDLMAAAVALAFLSGGLATRGGGLLELWSAHDAGFGTRMGLLGAGAVAAIGAILVYHREIASIARKAALTLLAGLMMLGGLIAGTWIDRVDGSSTGATITNTSRALSAAMTAPVNRLMLGLVAILAGIQISFEREPGSYRVIVSRVLMFLGFGLVYAFGASATGMDAAFRHMMTLPEMSIPLATVALLACCFGQFLVTGYNFESQAKAVGIVLSAIGITGLFAFAVLVAQPTREPWTMLLGEPFAGLSRPFRDSGSLLGIVLALSVVERAVVFGGIRVQDRTYRKRY
jgi:hypothetical protein